MGEMVFSGFVTSGEGMATDMGCPTANIALEGGGLIPALGVYVGLTSLRADRFPSVVCINDGRTGAKLKMEVHLLNQQKDLVGQFLEVRLLEKRRILVPFESNEQMSAVIAKDLEEARVWFRSRGYDLPPDPVGSIC